VGGIGTYAEQLAKALTAAGHDIHVFCPDYEDDRAAAEVVGQDNTAPFRITRFRSGRAPGGPLRMLSSGIACRRFLASVRPDWILLMDLHAQMLAKVTAGLSASRLPAMAAVLHGSEFHHLTVGRRARWLARPALDRCKVFLVNGRVALDRLTRYGGSAWERRAVPIGAGVTNDLLRESPAPERQSKLRELWDLPADADVLLTVARLIPLKGVELVLRMLAELNGEDGERPYYLVAGEGPDRTRLEELTETLNLKDRVRFIGFVRGQQLVDLYDLAAVYVQMSHEIGGQVESLGITYLEAAARGLPTLGFLHGGVPDVVRSGETGLLVPEKDLPAACTALKKLLEDPELRRRMGKAGQDWVRQEHTWEAVAGRVIDALTADGGASS
jgi:phosphatidylinositol alpha-1,6-mannosyltransferase